MRNGEMADVYSSHNFSPHSEVRAAVYLMKYESSKKTLYKIGISNLGSVDRRRIDLQRSIDKSSTPTDYVVDIVDYFECKNKYQAYEIEHVFLGYNRLRDSVGSKKHGRDISGNRELFSRGIVKKWEFFRDNGKFDPKGINGLDIVRYCKKILQSRWPEAEEEIAKHPKAILLYARDVIKGKWAEVEEILLNVKFDSWSRIGRNQQLTIHQYALLRNERWPEYERMIESWIGDGEDMHFPSFSYCEEYMRSPWYEIEDWILENGDPILYCEASSRDKWPELEEQILLGLLENRGSQKLDEFDRRIIVERLQRHKNYFPRLSKGVKQELERRMRYYNLLRTGVRYSKSVLKSRWPEIEDFLLDWPEIALDYCSGSMDGRWEELEHDIIRGLRENHHGKYRFDGTTPEGAHSKWSEKKTRYYSFASTGVRYSRMVLDGRWPEIEEYVIDCPQLSLSYCIHSVKDPWEEFEERHRKLANSSVSYHARACAQRSEKFEKNLLNSITRLSKRIKRGSGTKQYRESIGLRQGISTSLETYVSELEISDWPELEECLNEGIRRVALHKGLYILPIVDRYLSMTGEWNGCEEALLEVGDLEDPESWNWPEIINSSIQLYSIRGERKSEIEDSLLKYATPRQLCNYARFCVKGRWLDAEDKISKSPDSALRYSLNVVKGRWIEGEEAIRKSRTRYADAYAYLILKEDWPEADVSLSQIQNKHVIKYQYS